MAPRDTSMKQIMVYLTEEEAQLLDLMRTKEKRSRTNMLAFAFADYCERKQREEK